MIFVEAVNIKNFQSNLNCLQLVFFVMKDIQRFFSKVIIQIQKVICNNFFFFLGCCIVFWRINVLEPEIYRININNKQKSLTSQC
jgi:hypothetical protein